MRRRCLLSQELAPVPNGKAVSKAEKFNWLKLGKQGKFELIPKGDINIDHAYQRDKTSMTRILSIARDFSWQAFGVLLCVRREDGTVWAFDGQHRKLAADKRSDVTKLPCLVFTADDLEQEARAFLSSNTVRGVVVSLDKYRALLTCKDKTALLVQAMVRSTGHQIGRTSTAVRCVAFLMKAMQLDQDTLLKIWPMAARIAQDHAVTDELVKALFTTERALRRTGQGSLSDKHNYEAISKLKYYQFDEANKKATAYLGGGEKTHARALVDCLNFRRTKNRIDLDKVPTNA
jgi:hypothetical protein